MAYTDVSAEQASELLDAAGMPALEEIEPLAGGWANSNYLLSLSDGARLVLKVWDEQTPAKVEQIISHTCWIAEHGVPTPVPLPLNDGERMMVRNGLAWMLQPFIEGGWLGSELDSLHDLGRVQALLHAVPECEGIPTEISIGFGLWRRMFMSAEEEDSWSPFLRLLEQEETILVQRIPEDLPRGLIHGDLYPDNVIGRPGEVLALLDFEEICVDSLAFDLVTTFVGFGWRDGEPVAERWHELLAGYETVRSLTEVEHAALPDLHRYAILSVAAWRYWQFVINMPGTEHADRYLEMVARLDQPTPFLGGG